MNPTCTDTAPIVAVDLDNLLFANNGGFDRIDIARFCDCVATEMGRNCVIEVFANGMTKGAEAVWAKFGAQVVRTGENADPYIIDWLFSEERAEKILIVSGDHAFANAARWHSSLKHRVIVYARRARAAYEMVFAADRVDFIDDLLLPQTRASGSPRSAAFA